ETLDRSRTVHYIPSTVCRQGCWHWQRGSSNPMRESNKLSPRRIVKLNDVGRYADGGGLYLQVSRVVKRTTKAWIFRYMLDGRARHMGIGSIDDFTLAEARDRARSARQQIKDGIDPIDARQVERDKRRLAAASRVTFKECGERYIAAFAPT